jgi:hypothetical protein
MLYLSIGACKESIVGDPSKSGIQLLGDNYQCNVVEILAYPDGGFIVGANSWSPGHQDFWIMRFGPNFNLIWERKVGGAANERLNKLLITRKGNILCGGFTSGFGQDSLPLYEDRTEIAYFHLLSAEGQSIWENNPLWERSDLGYWDYTGYGQKIDDMVEEEDGKFAISLNVGRQILLPNTIQVGIMGSLMRIDQSGVKELIYSNSNYYSGVIGRKDSVYYAFVGNQKKAGFMAYSALDTGGYNLINRHYESIYFRFDDFNTYKGQLGTQESKNGEVTALHQFILLNNSVERHSFEFATLETKTYRSIMNLENLTGYAAIPNEGIILAFADGHILFLKNNFELIREIQTDWKVHHIAFLSDDLYVAAIEQEDKILLVKFNSEGNVQE